MILKAIMKTSVKESNIPNTYIIISVDEVGCVTKYIQAFVQFVHLNTQYPFKKQYYDAD